MTLLRQDTDYAMRILVELCLNPKDVISTPVLASRTDVPLPFAHKILKRLSQAGIVACKRGAAGGYCLACPPDEINLCRIVESVQGRIAISRCLLGRAICPRKDACSISKKLGQIQGEFISVLKNTTLKDVLEEMSREQHKVSGKDFKGDERCQCSVTSANKRQVGSDAQR